MMDKEERYLTYKHKGLGFKYTGYIRGYTPVNLTSISETLY